MPRPLRLLFPGGTLRADRLRARRAGVALLCVLLVAAGCSQDAPGAQATLVEGAAERAGEHGWDALAVGDEVPSGSRLRADEDGARLRFAVGEVWMSAGAVAVVERDRVELERGEVLLVTTGVLQARWEDVEIAGTGVVRLASGVTPRAAVYDGNAEVRRPAEARSLAALRQLDLALHRLPASGAPLQYRGEDAWDARWLAGALAFDAETERMIRGIDRQFGTAPQAPDFYEAFVAVDDTAIPLLRETSRVVDGEDFGPPSDALVTLFVARAAATAFAEPVERVVRTVAGLRVEGARWGLVGAELGITTVELARAVDLAQERRLALGVVDPIAVEAPSIEAAPEPLRIVDDEPPVTADPSQPPPPPPPSDDDGGEPSPPRDSPDQPIVLPEPITEVIDETAESTQPAVDAVEELVDELLGGLP